MKEIPQEVGSEKQEVRSREQKQKARRRKKERKYAKQEAKLCQRAQASGRYPLTGGCAMVVTVTFAAAAQCGPW